MTRVGKTEGAHGSNKSSSFQRAPCANQCLSVQSVVQQTFARLLFARFSIQIDCIFQLSMLKTAVHRCVCAILILLPMCAAAQQEAQPLPAAANEFVQQILSRSGSPSAVAVSFQNVANLPPESQ